MLARDTILSTIRNTYEGRDMDTYPRTCRSAGGDMLSTKLEIYYVQSLCRPPTQMGESKKICNFTKSLATRTMEFITAFHNKQPLFKAFERICYSYFLSVCTYFHFYCVACAEYFPALLMWRASA